MDNISEYDERQLKLMYKCLASFQQNQIQLSSLIGSLEFLLNAMESVEKEWERKFLNEITTLETINAIEIMETSEKEKIKFNKNESVELVNKAVMNLKKMVSDLLEKYLKTPDPKVEKIAIEGDSRWLICPNCNDAWESMSSDAMVVCPKCEHVCHNPRYKEIKEK